LRIQNKNYEMDRDAFIIYIQFTFISSKTEGNSEDFMNYS